MFTQLSSTSPFLTPLQVKLKVSSAVCPCYGACLLLLLQEGAEFGKSTTYTVFGENLLYAAFSGVAGTLSGVPDSGMPSRAQMWRKAQEVLTAEEIATAGTTGMAFLRRFLTSASRRCHRPFSKC